MATEELPLDEKDPEDPEVRLEEAELALKEPALSLDELVASPLLEELEEDELDTLVVLLLVPERLPEELLVVESVEAIPPEDELLLANDETVLDSPELEDSPLL